MILSLLLQITPVQPIVKGTALPPPGTDEAAVMAPVDALLRAIERHDGPAVIASTVADGAITAMRTAPDGTPQRRTIRWADFAASLKDDGKRIEERLGQPAIEFDDGIAMVWAPYVLLVDGKASHCGTDHFDIVREAGRWKILNVTYSHRTTGCTQ